MMILTPNKGITTTRVTPTSTKRHTLVVLTGPTGIGKTELSLALAKALNTVIVSSDSRQIYRELKIGTAAPTESQLAQVAHHMVGSQSVNDYYSAYQYEQEVLELLQSLFQSHDAVLLVGGSMMYIDALCSGIDDVPTISDEVRTRVMELYHKNGLEFLQQELKKLDPKFYEEVDLKNPKRVIHAVEVCYMSGGTYSSLRTRMVRQRPFDIVRIALDMHRDELYRRINLRVEQMMNDGLLEEARRFYPLRHLNSLNTVGYKELFEYFDEKVTLQQAVELIQRNSRRYAKRQLTWLRGNKDYQWFHPSQAGEIIQFVLDKVGYPGR